MHYSPKVTLLYFTCSSREYLLKQTVDSFRTYSNFGFAKTVLNADGKISHQVVDYVKPDLFIQSPERKGYVVNIAQAIKMIDTPYFFWLEDDWCFHTTPEISHMVTMLEQHLDWVQITLSKYGPLPDDIKVTRANEGFYHNSAGFSANPCLCRTEDIQNGFAALHSSAKGNKLGEDGFENFLTRYFNDWNKKCIIADTPRVLITHEGYLESTARAWHMTNSIVQKPDKHLLTIPYPSPLRRLQMFFKLGLGFSKMAVLQFFNNAYYEHAFRIIASIINMRK